MNTSEANIKKRKVIDLDERTFRILSVKAAARGTNLKSLIENFLKKVADDMEDEELYKYLVKNHPEGKEMITNKEKEAFENWLGL